MDWNVSQTVFGLPRSHWACTFENFKWPSKGVQNAIAQWGDAAQEGKKGNLLLTGTPGNGKTHLAVALYRWGVLRWGTLLCSFIQVPEFFHTVKQTFNSPGSEDPFRDLEEAKKLVILDDILGRTPTPWELDHIIFRLINTAYTNGASLIATTNYTLDELSGILKPHEVSRLTDGVKIIRFEGKDQRPPTK